MSLISFLNDLFKEDGFELVDSNSKKYVIGNPKKEKPIVIKLLDQKLMQKLLINPDLYFGEAYMDGSLVIQNGTLTEFLDLAFKNIGRGDINFYGSVIKKIKGTFRYLTNFNKIVKSKENSKNNIQLDIRETQTAAIQLFESKGFVKWGENPTYAYVNGNPIKGYYYYKNI